MVCKQSNVHPSIDDDSADTLAVLTHHPHERTSVCVADAVAQFDLNGQSPAVSFHDEVDLAIWGLAHTNEGQLGHPQLGHYLKCHEDCALQQVSHEGLIERPWRQVAGQRCCKPAIDDISFWRLWDRPQAGYRCRWQARIEVRNLKQVEIPPDRRLANSTVLRDIALRNKRPRSHGHKLHHTPEVDHRCDFGKLA